MKNAEKSELYKHRRKYLYGPLIIVETFIVFTIILYIFGPWDWQTKNPLDFYLLLITYNIALIIGYFISINKKPPKLNILNEHQLKDNKVKKPIVIRYLNIAIYIYLIFTIFNCIRVTGLHTISPTAYVNEVIKGITNPALQYKEKFILHNGDLYGGSILSYTNVLLSPFIYPVIPLSIYYFKELKMAKKILVITLILLESSRWIAIGTNKGLFDIAITIVTVLLIKQVQNKYYKKIQGKRNFTKLKAGIMIILPIYFFVNAISDRLGSKTLYNRYIDNIGINPNSLLMIITPDYLKTTLILLSSYLTQGYYALSMAITLPFTPMFGIGNSMFLMENFKKIYGIDVFKYTYQAKLATLGWDPFVRWHTFYTWIANDVSFIGVIMVMFIIGYAYAAIWKDVVLYNNPIAIVLMTLYSIMFAYISANNQVLTYPTTFTAFSGLTLYWIITKKRFRLKGTMYAKK